MIWTVRVMWTKIFHGPYEFTTVVNLMRRSFAQASILFWSNRIATQNARLIGKCIAKNSTQFHYKINSSCRLHSYTTELPFSVPVNLSFRPGDKRVSSLINLESTCISKTKTFGFPLPNEELFPNKTISRAQHHQELLLSLELQNNLQSYEKSIEDLQTLRNMFAQLNAIVTALYQRTLKIIFQYADTVTLSMMAFIINCFLKCWWTTQL